MQEAKLGKRAVACKWNHPDAWDGQSTSMLDYQYIMLLQENIRISDLSYCKFL